MRSYWALVKKESIELARTYRSSMLAVVLVALAIMSPATAYFMADILEAAGISALALGDPSLLNPTYLSSFEQFFKNMGQIGLLVLTIIFAGIVANDISKQTMVPLITKGLRRATAIYAKLTVSIGAWVLLYSVSLVVMFGYTAYYFTISNAGDLVLPLIGLFEFGVMLISFALLGGVLFKNQIGALLTAGGFVIILTLIGVFFPAAETFNPIVLSTHGFAAASGHYAIEDFVTAMCVGAGIIVASVVTSIVAFRRVQF